MYNFHKKEAPLLGLQGLGGGLGFLAGGGVVESLYSDDVFSTFLYDGTGSSLAVNNGIDLSDEGGAVWIKARSDETYKNNTIVDSERGKDTGNSFKVLYPNLNDTQYSPGSAANATVTSFNSNGFTAGNNLNTNVSGGDYVAWTFRKAPGFFDIQTWQGNGTSGRQIAHNLGSVPGFILIKSYLNGGGTGWMCYHRSLGNTKAMRMDSTNPASNYVSSAFWNNTDPTSTHFTLGNHEDVNGDFSSYNRTYIAYIFAHDDQSFGTNGDQSIIKCGSFTGANHTESLGFEPQWLLAKRTDSTGDWFLVDNMRGFFDKDAGDSKNLRPNTNNDENTAWFHLNSDGFYYSSSSATYIYVAIRRPHKPPTLATNVFNILNDVGSGSSRIITAGNLIDLQISKSRNGTGVNDNWYWLTRIQNNKHLSSDSTSNENTTQTGSTTFDEMDGMSVAAGDGWTNASPYGGPYIRYFLTRASGFFDIVTYSGNSTAGRTIPHNLEVKPELMIVKARSGAANQNWFVYNSNDTATDYMMLNDTSNSQPSANVWNNTEPTSSVFSVGGSTFTNATNYTYIAYLFATLDGISKVGTYDGAGSGNSVDVDCGFSAAPRFVMIKDTEVAANWYVYDSVRGIVSGNDPILFFDANASEQTATDDIDPLNSGFRVVSTNSGLNTSGRTYLFLAIA